MEDTSPTPGLSSLIPPTPEGRVKLVANLVVGNSVSKVFKTILRQNFVPQTPVQNVQLYVAAFALGGMVAKGAHAYTDEKIDWAFGVIKKVQGKTDDVEKTETTEAPAE